MPTSRQTSDYPLNTDTLHSSSNGQPVNGAHRTQSITDSAYQGGVPEESQLGDLASRDQQYRDYAGTSGLPQAASKSKGKLRSKLSKMAHGITGDSDCHCAPMPFDECTQTCCSYTLYKCIVLHGDLHVMHGVALEHACIGQLGKESGHVCLMWIRNAGMQLQLQRCKLPEHLMHF